MLIRCQRCDRKQEAEGGACVACGAALPAVEPLDGRAIAVRQAAVLRVLTPAEREALAVIVDGLGLVSGWWKVRAVHDVFVLLAGQRAMERRMARGASRTAALRTAAGELGVAYTTLRDAVNGLLVQKGVP